MLSATEIEALNSITPVLDALEPDSRTKVMIFLMGRLGTVGTLPTPAPGPADQNGSEKVAREKAKAKVTDIRELRAEKSPKSDVEMATIVAFYLQEEAPPAEHKDTLNKSDVEKYFKQAGHKLPERAEFTLNNAKNAGYLDLVGKGKYRLNPVGYNLVAHNLPGAKRKVVKPAAKPRKKPQQTKK